MARTVLGPDPEILTGQLFQERIHPDDRWAVTGDLLRLTAGGSDKAALTLQFRIADDAGRWRHVEANVVDHSETPAVTAVVLTCVM